MTPRKETLAEGIELYLGDCSVLMWRCDCEEQ